MPRLSDSMEEGTVAKWLVEEGASVTRGQVLVEIDTDKATMEYESESHGTLLQILVAEGETAPIGAAIARIGAPGEAVEAPSNSLLQGDGTPEAAATSEGAGASSSPGA